MFVRVGISRALHYDLVEALGALALLPFFMAEMHLERNDLRSLPFKPFVSA